MSTAAQAMWGVMTQLGKKLPVIRKNTVQAALIGIYFLHKGIHIGKKRRKFFCCFFIIEQFSSQTFCLFHIGGKFLQFFCKIPQ